MFKFIMIFGGILCIALLVHFIAAARFQQFAADLNAQVIAETLPLRGEREIPTAIEKFVLRSGVDPENLARSVRLTQTAEMRLAKGGDWQALTAEQVIATGATGFVWVAEQAMGPLTKFRVIDAYVGGVGRLNVRILGSIPVVNNVGADADVAEAMRYLSELVWAPDAMIGNPNLVWQEEANGVVSVSLDLPAGVAKVSFMFGDEGDIIEVLAKDRPAELVDGKAVLRDWVIKVGDYQEFDGRRIPTQGEVGYIYDDGYEAYWRGEVISYTVKTQ